jgi:hypothetical protein
MAEQPPTTMSSLHHDRPFLRQTATNGFSREFSKNAHREERSYGAALLAVQNSLTIMRRKRSRAGLCGWPRRLCPFTRSGAVEKREAESEYP